MYAYYYYIWVNNIFHPYFQFNSCPLRRIPQRYVIGTSTKLDLGDFKLPEHLNDEYFKKNKKSVKRSVKRKQGEDIFASKKEVRRTSLVLLFTFRFKVWLVYNKGLLNFLVFTLSFKPD